MRLHEETINRMNTSALMALGNIGNTGNSDDNGKNGFVPFDNPYSMLIVDADDARFMEYTK